MKVDMIDIKIENSKNPFMVFQLELLNSLEEIEQITDNVENILTLDEIVSIENNVIAADVSKIKDYIIINQSFIEQFKQLMSKCGLKFKMTNIINDVWNMNNIKEFISLFGDEDLNPELTQQFFPGLQGNFEKINEILKVVVESQFTLNDVLDKINEQGIDSLNELNKYILEKESR